ncbi:kelch repeat-containing protein [Candidatus Binatus sp.]|uniref:kelch repeat-containing protein n=1 Tax=Candidatus Binatus sp. TaxID=2811406 RepID=UPI002F94CED0
MQLISQTPRGTAGRIGAIVLKSLLVILVLALPIAAEAPGVWTISASLNTARANHAAGMLPNGEALIVGGTGSSGALTSAEIYSLSGNTFTTLPTGLNLAVSGLTATVLGDNTVLLAGGLNGSGAPVATAELYNPSLGAFVTLPAMNTARSHHTATLLQDGTVLIAGGAGTSGQLASLEIYNPVSQTFSVATASLHSARQDHTATILADGTVLIAAGSNSSGPLASGEIYNPATGAVTETGSLNAARTLASASMLYDMNGDVLIEGGRDAAGNDLDTAEEFDPTTGTFTTLTAQMKTARSGHLGVTLPYNGKVLIAGGTSAGAPVAATELYDPIVSDFVDNGEMSTARDEFAANFFAVPAVGQVLLSGGLDDTGAPLALAETFSYQTIRTDQPDYPPGSPVIIYGAGFAPGETVITQIQESDGDNTELTDSADSTGSFTDYNYYIEDTDGGVTFVMTATGATSGLTAQDRFTDHIASVTVAVVTGTVTAGNPASYTAYCTQTANEVTSATYTTAATGGLVNSNTAPTAWNAGTAPYLKPAGAGWSFSPNPIDPGGDVTACGSGHKSTLTITTTCGGANNTPAGTYHFYVAGEGNDNHYTTSSSQTLTVNACAQTLTSIAVTPSPVTVTAGNPAAYTTTLTTNGGGGALSAALSVTTALPTGVTATFVPNPISSVHNGSTSALTLTTTCGGANNTPAGTYPFTVQAVADTTKTTTGTLVVNTCATTTTLTSSLNPSPYGQSVTFTATVTSSGNPVTCGTVTFDDGVTPIATGVPLGSPSSDQAAYTTSSLAMGNHSITAVYVPSACLYIGSTSNAVTQAVYTPLKVTPYSVIFAYSVVGQDTGTGTTTSPARIETAANESANPIHMGTVTVSPSQFAIVADHCSGVTLAPSGGSCTVSVNFTANAATTFTGTMSFPSNSPGGTKYVSLKGTGISGLINQSLTVNFPNTVVGNTSAAKTVTMSNPNPTPVELTVTSIALVDSCGIQVSSDGCSGAILGPKGSIGPIPPRATCTIGVRFAPTSPGPCSETLTVNSDAGNSPSMITLVGNGTLVAPTFSPNPLKFGKVTVGTPSTVSVNVTNPNPEPMTFNPPFTISGGSGEFSVASTTCTGSVAGTCTIDVTFTPSRTGIQSGTLSVFDNGGTGTQNVAVSGTGY